MHIRQTSRAQRDTVQNRKLFVKMHFMYDSTEPIVPWGPSFCRYISLTRESTKKLEKGPILVEVIEKYGLRHQCAIN